MKVLYLSNSRIPSRTANSVHVMKMAQAFIQEGHETLLVSQEPPDRASASKELLQEHYGLSVDVPLHRIRVRSRWPEYEVAVQSAFMASRWKPDFVLTRDIPTAAATVALGIPTFYEQHSPDIGPLKRQLLKWFLKQRSSLGMIVITNALKQEVLRLWGDLVPSERVVVLPDAVDLERFQGLGTPVELRTKLGLPERFTEGYAGHLYKGRGIDLILDLAESLSEIQFLIVGGNDQDVELYRAKVKSRSLANVLLTGFVPNSILPGYLGASDILLAPYQQKVEASGGGDISRWTSPMKIFEYLAAGRPIIASDLPVLKEVLTHETSICCPPSELQVWRRSLLALRDNDELREAMSLCSSRAGERHSWIGRVQSICEQYNSRIRI